MATTSEPRAAPETGPDDPGPSTFLTASAAAVAFSVASRVLHDETGYLLVAAIGFGLVALRFFARWVTAASKKSTAGEFVRFLDRIRRAAAYELPSTDH